MADSHGAPFNEVDETADKVFCANCIHCKLLRTPMGNGNQYYLRVRCDAGRWRKKLGEEKYYKYFTVARRSVDNCDDYIPMGDAREYIKELKKTLPIKDEIYSL
ncbi:MAG: hypothetical protein E4H36_01175 [Spirochaetales bacterium]|nr:MAG: hypothetical protein E4H36_01175 [Spirochaetales bacterium]